MNAEEFRQHGRQMVDYIANYLENIREREVVHRVTPGYLRELLPNEAPEKPEDFNEVFKDIEQHIMPGITHWHSPYFHGYFAAGNSFPSILGDMLSDAIGCIGFSWATSPACTELEVITTDWLAKMLALPEHFLHSHPGSGGGVIQSTASETVLLALLAARTRKVRNYKQKHPDVEDHDIIKKLVCYTSDQANSSVERSSLLGAVQMVILESDKEFCLRGETLKNQIEQDKQQGKIPFFLCATLGTTGSCAFDKLDELGPICEEEDMWLHIDAAYAGSAFVCPEFRHFMKGLEYAETFSINPHKWMLINFDCSIMWIRDRSHVVDAFNVDPVYLKHGDEGRVPDYRHCRLAKEFEALILKDQRFEIVADVVMGLVCFRVKAANKVTERLLDEILADGRIYLIPAFVRNVYFLRFAICAERTTSEDIQFSFRVIQECLDKVVKKHSMKNGFNHQPIIYIDAPNHLGQEELKYSSDESS
ncbi:hypothetical protein FSP39_005488 [Pinctada imbricata]|uniref:Aromatic-L-amino-acid decarboxylase n=1 Tax=Pinctada imbricata TaxID=66713 RepID=A0AA89C6N0_PINIB|nr:hypothetical protein FSP39_005488 [Pinctada imbricata]